MLHVIRTIIDSNREINIFSGNGIVTFVNPYAYTYIRKKTGLFDQFDYIFVDGMLLANFVTLFYGTKIKRNSFDMTGLAPECFSYAINQGKTLYFVGDTEFAINNAVKIIKQHYPEIKIIGSRNGFFKDEMDEDSFIKELADINPDIVIVGMGLFRQENFLVKLKKSGWNGLGFTCGGFFHQVTKKIDYYPSIINKLNLRWVYRFIKEPSVRWRLLRIIFLFPFLFIYDYCHQKVN